MIMELIIIIIIIIIMTFIMLPQLEARSVLSSSIDQMPEAGVSDPSTPGLR